jgi:hypothetical protein
MRNRNGKVPSAGAAAGSIDFLATLTFSKTALIFRPRGDGVNEIHGRIKNVS